MTPIVIRPGLLRHFGSRYLAFRLVIDAEDAEAFTLAAEGYPDADIITVAHGETLASVLAGERCPAECDLVVILRRRMVVSPTAELVGRRRLSILPCGSTPVSLAQVAQLVKVLERNDPADIQERCTAFISRVENSEFLSISANGTPAEARFHAWGDYDWNVQAGVIEPGEQQIAPAGEVSAVPLDLFTFDPSRRLGLDGRLVLQGAPIVHASIDNEHQEDQARLFAELSCLLTAPLAVDVTGGEITGLEPLDPEAKPAAEALTELFELDPRYRVVWEFGIGMNAELTQLPGNCGPNEVFGGSGASLHLGLGLTPSTRYALTFSCVTSVVRDAEGHVLAGAPARRLNRQKSASCGCH